MLALRAFLARKNNRPPSHPTRRKRKGEDAVNMLSQDKEYILPGGPEVLKNSLMLGSIYSYVKELLRKTPSKYTDYK